MKLKSILSVLIVCASLASQVARAGVCLDNRLPSNPDSAYTMPSTDDGTVTHSSTGLMWKRCSEGQDWNGSTCTGVETGFNWQEALVAGSSSSFAGYTDWRVPNIKELRSLVEECRYQPAINDTIFPGTPDKEFWSSSPKLSNFDNQFSWTVNARAGLNADVPRSFSLAVRLVRDELITTNPPDAVSAGLNDTGITACGDAATISASCASVSADSGSFPRQDGRYGAGTGFNFTKISNDGRVLPESAALGANAADWACTRDNTSGLIWEVKTTSGLRSQSHTYKWNQSGSGVASTDTDSSTCQMAGRCDTDKFVIDVNTEGLCGFGSGWRVPDVKELEGVVNFGRNNPSVDPAYFPNTRPSDYWSATSSVSNPGVVAWNVSFADGMVGGRLTSNLAHVRLVRGTRETSIYTLVTLPNGDAAVTDSRTGLMWKREHEMVDPSQPDDWQTRINALPWQEALQRAVNDRTGGYSDWRLPNIRELRSLVDESRFRPAIDPIFSPQPYQGWFWSSSPYMGETGVNDFAMPVYFDVGSDAAVGREFRQYARLVRGGDNFDRLAGAVSLSASTLNFAPRSINTTSAAQSLILANNGSSTINIAGITVSAGDFAQTNTCNATLAPGSTCTISVTFTPTEAGSRTDDITIASDAPGSPHRIGLAGTGGDAPLPFRAGLNDTGITACGDATTTSSSNCANVAADGSPFPRQDARYGRDAQNDLSMLTKLGGGSAGFDFSRVTNDGTVNNAAPLGPGGTDWACTRDNVTGLTWEVKTTSGLRNLNHTYSLYQGGVGVQDGGSCSGGTGCDTTKFVADVNAAGLCGKSDWRMPTIKELENIADFSRVSPSIDPDYFRNTAPNQYWSSTTNSSSPGQTYWVVDFNTGTVTMSQALNSRSVRLVRGTATPTNQFTVTDGGKTVTDASTGLVWKRDFEMRDPANPGTWQNWKDTFSWSEALQRPFAANNANFAGYSDWRLPNLKELRSLISETRNRPAIDTTAFPATLFQSYFWSASPAGQDRSWTVDFDTGLTLTKPRYFVDYVRLVRGGDSFDNLNASISLSTNLLNFDPQIVLTPSGARVVTISNYGKVMIGSIIISTPASDYERTTTCTATLAVGQSCSISVTFTPTALGARAATITISSDATSHPLNLNLAGTGAASEYALTVTKAGTGSGTVSPWGLTCASTSCTVPYPTNTDVTLTATANIGGTFTGWSGSGCSGTGTCTVRMSQARTVTASFAVSHSLTITKGGTGSGIVTSSGIDCGSVCSASYAGGTSVILTATSSSGSVFTGWLGAGCFGTGLCVASMTQAHLIKANFALNTDETHTLTVIKAGSGSGTVVTWTGINCGAVCSTAVPSHTNLPLAATASPGSTFTGWSGGGCTGMGACVASMTQSRVVTATFQLTSTPPISLYDGIYQWDATSYLSVHQVNGDAIVASIYWVYDANKVQIGGQSLPVADTFDLLSGKIVDSTAKISGTRFYRACKLSYELEFNSDSTITVTRTGAINSPGVSLDQVNCAARYSAEPTIWPVTRIF